MLESFYPDHVMRRLSKTEEEFWEGRNLDINDWQGKSKVDIYAYIYLFELGHLFDEIKNLYLVGVTDGPTWSSGWHLNI